MLFQGLTGNQYIVKVDENPAHITEDPVHQALERLGRIFKPKRHPQELI